MFSRQKSEIGASTRNKHRRQASVALTGSTTVASKYKAQVKKTSIYYINQDTS